MQVLGERLKECREQKKLTHQEIADLIHINRVTYTGYESGNHNPSLETLKTLADTLQTSVDYLLGRYK